MSLAELLDGARMCLDLWDDGSEDGEDGLLDGDFFSGAGTRFADRWSSYTELLTEVADALENGTPVGASLRYVGVPFAGELVWEPAPQPAPGAKRWPDRR
ncbi:hypothetical protein ABZ930_09315 [Streptomyces sp. NPDC046716]|uniref:hypothetical protein n=1 Tax=Streptomyces sp. NPDC046716 TaxID=3157093 RepID=UPI0034086335